MPDDALQRSSLAYRKFQPDIWKGKVPDKYRRLLPYIPGPRVLEIGAAEGVLSLLLSREHKVEHVTALELRDDRRMEGLRLKDAWAERGFDVSRCEMKLGDIRDNLELLSTVDTLVAIRSIYYLKDDAHRVLDAAWDSGVQNIVLCGNKNRQRQARTEPDTELGRFNSLAAVEGMRSLLHAAGYQVTKVIDEGDPIVVGGFPRLAA